MNRCDLETSALVVNVSTMERNLERLAGYTHGFAIVAKVDEAEVMLSVRTDHILVEYSMVGRSKLKRLSAVASRSWVTVALDSIEAARQPSEGACEAGAEFVVLAEADLGLGRVGVKPREPLAEFCRGISRRLAWSSTPYFVLPGIHSQA